LDDLDLERQFLEHIVDELDRRFLVVFLGDLEYTDPGAVIDRDVLVHLRFRAGQRLKELHVDLDTVTE
jgi:hypothetical protein